MISLSNQRQFKRISNPLVSESESSVSSVENKPQPTVKQAKRLADDSDSEHENLIIKTSRNEAHAWKIWTMRKHQPSRGWSFWSNAWNPSLCSGQGGLYIIDQHAALRTCQV